MRVGLVSTYPPRRCGIGTYTQHLARALAELPDTEVYALAETGAMDGDDRGVHVAPTYDRAGPWGDAVLAAAAERPVDVVHVQHSPDLFGQGDELPTLCRRLADRGIPTVVTLHTVHGLKSALLERQFGTRRFARALGRAASAVVVHQPEAAKKLERLVPRSRLVVIPHGTPEPPMLDRAECRVALGVPESARLLVSVGFIHPQKNLHVLVRALPLVRERVGDVRLIIAGSVQNPSRLNRLYVSYLRSSMARLGGRDVAWLREEFIADAEVHRLLRAADIALLPYWQWYGSASGIVHLAMANRTPMLCSRSPKFAEVGEIFGRRVLVPTHSPSAWADRIAGLLRDPNGLDALRQRLDAATKASEWPVVAGTTRELYVGLREALARRR